MAIEKYSNEIGKETNRQLKMSFGKHKGVSLEALPIDYIKWLVEKQMFIRVQPNKHHRLVELLNAEVEKIQKEQAINPPKPEDFTHHCLGFGKHATVPFCDLPIDYLKYLIKEKILLTKGWTGKETHMAIWKIYRAKRTVEYKAVSTLMKSEWQISEGQKIKEGRFTVESYYGKEVVSYGGHIDLKRMHRCVDRNGNRFLIGSIAHKYEVGESFTASFTVWKNCIIKGQKVSISVRPKIFTKEQVVAKNLKKWKKL